MSRPLHAAVFASGSGSNLQALLDHERSGWDIGLLVTDREGVGALGRAQDAEVPARVIPVSGRDASEFALEMVEVLSSSEIDFVLLAGYLRLVPSTVVERYRERILNIHPALLPAFGGKGMYGRRVHEAVLASGARVSGPTVHLVSDRYDEGRILAQWPVPVRHDDTPDALAARVLAAEHGLYPLVADHLSRCIREGRSVSPFDLPADAFPPVPRPDLFPLSHATLDESP